MHLILVSSNKQERDRLVGLLRQSGLEVEISGLQGPALANYAADTADVIAIDLSRAPARGKDTAIFLRRRKSTRAIPLLLLGGQPEKVEEIKKVLPDAFYAPWEQAAEAAKEAAKGYRSELVVPPDPMKAYSSVPLWKKLTIKPGDRVALVDAPKSVEQILGKMPSEVSFYSDLYQEHDLAIWFVRSRSDLEQSIPHIIAAETTAPIWIAWPKKASGMDTDLTQQVVRELGMAAGLVDYKICSVDANYSALLFSRKRL